MGKLSGNKINKQVSESCNDSIDTCQAIITGPFRQIMDTQRDMICCFQTNLNTVYVNPAFCKFFNNTAEDFINVSFIDLLPPQVEKLGRIEISRLLDGAAEVSFTTSVSNGKGEQRVLWWICHLLRPGIIQASARDISELMAVDGLAHTTLVHGQDMHGDDYFRCLSRTNTNPLDGRTIFKELPFMVWALDEDLNIVFWNRECQKITGYSEQEVFSPPGILNRLFPDDAARKEWKKKMRNTSPMTEWIHNIRCANGDSKWISCLDMGNFFHVDHWKYVLISLDKTNKIRTELALKESERHYRSLFASIQAGLIHCREAEGEDDNIDYLLIDHNDAVEKMLGKTKLDLQGKSVHELFPNIADNWDRACEAIKKQAVHERFQYYYHPRQQILEFTLFSPAPGEFAALFDDITDIINTREELYNQLEFMQTLIDTIPNPIFFKDKEGRFFNCNKAFEMYVGRARESILNHDIGILESYLKPEDMDRIQSIEKSLMEFPHQVVNEYSFRHADGNKLDLITNRASFFDTAGKFAGIVGVLTNISEKRNMERKLQKQLHFQQFLSDIIPAPIFFLNSRGHYVRCNKAFEDYIGKTREEIIGQAASEVSEYDDPWEYYLSGHIDEDQLTRTPSGTYLTKFHHADGSIRDVIVNRVIYRNTDGVPAGMAAIILDITAQREAERKLAEQVEFLGTLIETIPNPVYYTDLEGNLIECNRAYAELLGKPKEELFGMQHLDVFTRQQVEEFYKRDFGLITSDSSSLSYDSIVKFADGRNVDLLIHRTILYDNQGSPKGLLGALTDLTEHREMQRNMARLDQYRIIGEMAAAIGHEVRNPMTTVRGFLQLMNEGDDFAVNKEYFDLMIEEIDRANSIITDFLSLGKGLHTELKPENLNQIIENSYLILSAEARKHEHILKMDLEEVPLVTLDFKQIRQLIFNLARNGLEAMTSPGILTISTCKADQEVLLSIKDQGSGIDSYILENLGKPFVTTKEKGTGLGLAVCYSIVERHGAQLEVETNDTGTIFYIRFPIPPG